MLNLNTTFPLQTGSLGSAYALPVLVDLNWLGKTMTSPEGGIIPSRASLAPSCPSNPTQSDDSLLCI